MDKHADGCSEKLEPEKGKAGPLCMASYKYLYVNRRPLVKPLRRTILTHTTRFNAVRVPTSPADIPVAYEPTLNHVVVVRNDRYFKVEVAGRGKMELAQAFREVKKLADDKPGPGLGIFTADDRDVWTEVRPV